MRVTKPMRNVPRHLSTVSMPRPSTQKFPTRRVLLPRLLALSTLRRALFSARLWNNKGRYLITITRTIQAASDVMYDDNFTSDTPIIFTQRDIQRNRKWWLMLLSSQISTLFFRRESRKYFVTSIAESFLCGCGRQSNASKFDITFSFYPTSLYLSIMMLRTTWSTHKQ